MKGKTTLIIVVIAVLAFTSGVVVGKTVATTRARTLVLIEKSKGVNELPFEQYVVNKGAKKGAYAVKKTIGEGKTKKFSAVTIEESQYKFLSTMVSNQIFKNNYKLKKYKGKCESALTLSVPAQKEKSVVCKGDQARFFVSQPVFTAFKALFND